MIRKTVQGIWWCIYVLKLHFNWGLIKKDQNRHMLGHSFTILSLSLWLSHQSKCSSAWYTLSKCAMNMELFWFCVVLTEIALFCVSEHLPAFKVTHLTLDSLFLFPAQLCFPLNSYCELNKWDPLSNYNCSWNMKVCFFDGHTL